MMGEFTITVDKKTLLEKLRSNREAHRATYDKAWDGYCKVMRAWLEEKLEVIKARKPIDSFVRHAAPDDHTGDYDEVIAMLEMSLDAELELPQSLFRQYVNDDWGWKQSWTTSNTAYLTA